MVTSLPNQVRDWNAEFQTLLDTDDSLEKFTALGCLAEDFIYVAEMYGRIIISEFFIPKRKKTIMPLDLGGEYTWSCSPTHCCQALLVEPSSSSR